MRILHFSLKFFTPCLQNLSKICFAHAQWSAPRFLPLILVYRWMEVVVVMAGCWSKLSLVETNCCSRPREKMTPTPHYQEKSAQLYVFLISWFARLDWVWVAEAADPGGGIKWSRCPVNLSSFQSWECPISCSGSAPCWTPDTKYPPPSTDIIHGA